MARRVRPVSASFLLALALLSAVACDSTEALRRRELIDSLPTVDVAVGDLRCVVRSDTGRRWAVIVGPGGGEYAAVAFDPETGREDYSTQRFLGLSEEALLARVDRGDPRALLGVDGARAGCLWVPNCPSFIGSGTLPGYVTAARGATPIDAAVLCRQSQLLAFLRARLGPPDRRTDPTFALVWTEDNCTLAPDFPFTTNCCRAHDACYDAGGDASDRNACDVALCACIEANGYPVLARVYLAAVRAFGWASFGR